ncbi:DUF58 domain-containing protein [Streptomyces parvulus]|nr:DUF58 domain-containing protein [Streptomyces parvulus]
MHWRSTARYGELMVRREEQPSAPAARCCWTPGRAFDGAGRTRPSNGGVGAASVLVHMLERGFSVRLLTDSGTRSPVRAPTASRARARARPTRPA